MKKIIKDIIPPIFLRLLLKSSAPEAFFSFDEATRSSKNSTYEQEELIDVVLKKNEIFRTLPLSNQLLNSDAVRKRWIKENIYTKIPGGLRAFAYFIYRYIFRLGFLDGAIGTQFHFLQAWWYRYLVDAKIDEVERYSKKYQISIDRAIYKVLGIQL